MDSDLYDEFGNFIGDANDSDSDSIDYTTANATAIETQADDLVDADADNLADANAEHRVLVLTKQSDLVQTVVVDPTHEGVDEPVIKPAQALLLENAPQEMPQTTYSKTYMKQVAKQMPQRIRSVAFCGALHSGKTSLIDELIMETHPDLQALCGHDRPLRLLDTHPLEVQRGISIFSSTASLLLQDLKYRSYLCHLLDTPGHPDFHEERAALLQIAHGVVFVVDVLEGLSLQGKKILSEAVKANVPIVVVLNKIDRLVLELRLPPRDFHAKVRSVLADINAHVYHNEYIATYSHETLFSPLKDNVLFALRVFGFCFSLHSWAMLYGEKFAMDPANLAPLLWGDVSFANGRFSKLSQGSSFEDLVARPLYKLVTHSLVFDSAEGSLASLLWNEFRVRLPNHAHKLNPQELLRTVFGALSQGLRDLVHLFAVAFSSNTSDEEHSTVKEQVKTVNVDTLDLGRLVAKVTRLLPSPGPSKNFLGLVRIYNGKIKVGDQVCVLADNSDGSDPKVQTVQAISIPVGRYNIPCDEAYKDQIVLIDGLDCISKFATLVSPSEKPIPPILPANFGNKSVFKVAVEPEMPSDLPRLVRGLQHLSAFYVSAIVKLEESGEYVVLAPGELYLDCFLHDLRHFEPDYLSIKVSDPMARFAESCHETSVTRIPIQTPNGKSEVSVIAEPITDKKLLSAIEQGKLKSSQPVKVMAKVLKEDFNWDVLAARSVWTFGPSDMQSPCILLDDSLEEETDKSALRHVKESIVAGFHMAVNVGPLCGEPIRRTKFKILDAVLDGAVLKNSGQVIPMTRNAVHCGLMTAAPRLLEPMYKAYITCTYNLISAVQTMLEKRRGWVIFEKEVPATKLFEIEGIVPVIDSPGLDTDMRLNTQGQAFCTLEFAKWSVVPGDPLDADCNLPAMQPVPRSSLARDFVMKTRKRKGLSGEPTLKKYVGQALYSQMQQSGIIN